MLTGFFVLYQRRQIHLLKTSAPVLHVSILVIQRTTLAYKKSCVMSSVSLKDLWQVYIWSWARGIQCVYRGPMNIPSKTCHLNCLVNKLIREGIIRGGEMCCYSTDVQPGLNKPVFKEESFVCWSQMLMWVPFVFLWDTKGADKAALISNELGCEHVLLSHLRS